MIALPSFGEARHLARCDMVISDGGDVLGEDTTSPEARIFRYHPSRARYVDWDLYERLDHDYSGKKI
jgi:hypothetical protein